MIYLDVENKKVTRVATEDSGNSIPYEGDIPDDFLNTFSLGKYLWNGENIVVNADYESKSSWNRFLDALGKHPSVALKITQSALGMILMVRIQRLGSAGTPWEGTEDTLIASWNASNINLSEEEEAGLNALAESADLPVRVIDGTLKAV